MLLTINLLLDYVNAYNAPGGAVFKKIKKVYPEICEIIDKTIIGRCWTEKLYRYTHPDHKDLCKMCSSKLRYTNWERGFQTYCSPLCKNSDPEIKIQREAASQKKFGTNNPMQNKEVQDKMKQTNIDRYGYENAAKNSEVQSRMRKTCLDKYGTVNVFSKDSPFREEAMIKAAQTIKEKYGVETSFAVPDILNKRKDTWLQKYGVNHPHQNSKIREKYKKTVLDRWGVDHPMQVAEILDKNIKNAKRSKKFVFPSGKVIMLQGFEPQALEILLNEGIQEDQILNRRADMPCIWYSDPNGKKRRYYPDFYLPHLKIVVEVKSQYTSQVRPDLIALKNQAAVDAGYQVRLMIL